MTDHFIQGEELGTAIEPKCGSCRCGKCPLPGHTYSFVEQQELQMIRDGFHYNHNKAKPEHINVSSYHEPMANRLDGKQNSNIELPVECKSFPFKSNIETKKSPKISPSQNDMDEENTISEQ